MSVTQDYKILTLTVGEYAAVWSALESHIEAMKERAALFSPEDDDYQEFTDINNGLLADAQSAIAKVRA